HVEAPRPVVRLWLPRQAPAPAGYARVVEQEVAGAVAVEHRLGERLDRIEIADIGAHAEHLTAPAELRNGRLEDRLLDVADDHARAFVEQRLHDSPPDAG